jgi:hypothetical protein
MSQAEMRGLVTKARHSRALSAGKGLGVRLALFVTCTHALGLLPACLVTDPVEFEVEQGSPPMLIDRPQTGVEDTPLGSIFWANTQQMTGWTFRARVRDEDVLQDLQLHWRIVKHMQTTPTFDSIDLPANGVSLTRDINVFVSPGDLSESECHKLEIAVSGNFTNQTEPAYFGLTLVPEDVARGVWWLLEGDKDLVSMGDAKQIVDTCPAFDAPVMQLGTAGQGQ